MDSVVFTPRLKLTRVTTVERGGAELEWIHELRSNEKATWWSIQGRAKSLEDTEKAMQAYLASAPTTTTPEKEEGPTRPYRVAYAVHKLLDESTGSDSHSRDSVITGGRELEPQSTANKGRDVEQTNISTKPETEPQTEFIGMVTLTSLDTSSLALPEDLTLPKTHASTTTTTTTKETSTRDSILPVEIAYMFLPTGWGKGYATESVKAVFESCAKGRSFWTPFDSLYIRAIVNELNPPSMRVMDKTGMVKTGVYELIGRSVFLAGQWRDTHRLHIYARYLTWTEWDRGNDILLDHDHGHAMAGNLDPLSNVECRRR
ncbi:hypothetical protein A1O1_06594 [Capronia coronata CBS 617.96]|uniref:N-acetyltransferase domain-containing protein n=1 Tax=Capronia coronata CBS 617.96 TaxID=1182541 RepID=W9YVB5_9EURO|nr:uncharacterized protein A1O1_06594 [Capronia coronata CBS 617.96]EXJ86224.1 hypothetical protein A1O1_06594 [Capronia coronata CBS 617.96]